MRQIVINRLRHTDDAHVPTALDGFEMNFVGRVLRIIAADVEKEPDIVRLENFEQPIHVLRGFLGLFLEIYFVTAGAERGD